MRMNERRFMWRRRLACLTVGAATTIVLACSGGLRIPDPKNELPFGYVDVPVQGATVTRTTFVGGWALDNGAITSVRIYLDGKYLSDARIGLERPDVSKVYPQYAHGANAHGWGVGIDLGDVTGAHMILVQATDDSGATRDLGSVSVTVKQQ